MEAGLRQLLQPEVINTMNGLELTARIIVEGFMSGGNKSQAIGIGQEFSQYRNYEPGDDLRQLDWKMYARSERYFIKQSQIETNITVKFLIDASRSMAYKEEGISKLAFAKILSAALAYLARKQGDTFGLYTVNANNIRIVRPRFEQQQFMRFLHELVELEAEGTWKKSGIDELFDHHGKELLVFISDFYDDEGDVLQFISKLKTSRNEVIAFHVMGKNELDLGQNGTFSFEDLESGQVLKVDTAAQKKVYKEKVSAWLDNTRNFLLEKGIAYEMVIMNDDPGKVLSEFLKHRWRLMR